MNRILEFAMRLMAEPKLHVSPDHPDFGHESCRTAGRPGAQRQRACTWLADYLSDGVPHRATEILAAAKAAGISEKTLRRASRGSVAVFQSARGWYWQQRNGAQR